MPFPRKAIALTFGAALLLGPAQFVSAEQSSRTATVTIVHGLPHFTADIYVNGKLLLDGFKPESEAGPLQLRPAVYHVAIRDVGASASSKPALAGSLRLRPGIDYSIVAHLNDKGNPALSVYRNPETPIAPGRARVLVRSVATIPSMTLEANGRRLCTGLASGGQASSLLRPGRYELTAFRPGATESIFPAQDLRLEGGTDYLLYVIGSGSDHTLDLMVQTIRGQGSSPSSIESGTGGLAGGPGLPPWVIAEIGLGASLLLAGVAGLRKSVRTR
jgi:hypothetical protein